MASKTISLFGVGIASALGIALLASTAFVLNSVSAQTTSAPADSATSGTSSTIAPSLDAVLPTGADITLQYPAAGTTPAPMIIDASSDGAVLIRGSVVAAGRDSLQINSWGGVWTIRTRGTGSVFSNATNTSGDMSAIAVGDFVGVSGSAAADAPWTVDATLVRDWTTTPYTEGTSNSVGASGSGSTTTTPQSTMTSPSTVEPRIDSNSSGGNGAGSTTIPGSLLPLDTSAGSGTDLSEPTTDVLDTSSATGTTSSAEATSAAQATSSLTQGTTSGLLTSQTSGTGVWNGTIAALGVDSFTLRTSTGTSYLVRTSPTSTTVSVLAGSATLSGLSVGDSVEVSGTLGNDGSITASNVRDFSR